eukprot:COSAG05_NODE_1049_length_6033_cov_7.763566_9_plen_160_part_00
MPLAHHRRVLDGVCHCFHRRPLHLLDVDSDKVASGLQRRVDALDHVLVVPVVRQHHMLRSLTAAVGASRRLCDRGVRCRRRLLGILSSLLVELEQRHRCTLPRRHRHRLLLQISTVVFAVRPQDRRSIGIVVLGKGGAVGPRNPPRKCRAHLSDLQDAM